MEYVTLKNTDLKVSRFCMGGCPMGGYDWGDTHEENFIDAIHTALDNGVNYFDTADTYGLGQSEKTLAKGLGSRRKEVIVQSKFGVKAGHGETVIDNSPVYIREALENTLSRLNTDYIDIYVVHYWDKVTPVDDIMEELQKQRDAGKIRYFGISNIRPKRMPAWAPYRGKFTTGQYEFSLACRDREPEIDLARETLDITPLTWGSLGQGFLTGKYDENTVFADNDRRRRDVYVNFHGEKLKHNLESVKVLRTVAENHNKSCAATAIRFILDYLKDSVVIAGVKNSKQLLGNLESMGWKLDQSEIETLDNVSRG